MNKLIILTTTKSNIKMYQTEIIQLKNTTLALTNSVE